MARVRAAYSFRDSWTVDAAPARVRDLVVDLERYPRWWPQVVAVASLGPDDAWVLCRSALPYTLDLVLHAVTRELPVLEVRVAGDLTGTVRFTVAAAGSGSRLDFAQRVEVGGALGLASTLGRPLLSWNHRRMMRGCRDGMRAALAPAPPSGRQSGPAPAPPAP